VGALTAVATLANGVWQYRRKVHLEIFCAYSDWYNEIVTPDIYHKWQSALHGDRELWPELTATMVKYLNLVWEEFYLSRDGVIPRRLSRLWLPEIQGVIASDFAKSTMEAYDFHFPRELTCKPRDQRVSR
jgi:hypothetical protein